MDHGIFMDKARIPTTEDLEVARGNTHDLWKGIQDHVLRKYPEAKEAQNFPGKKYGWSFRTKYIFALIDIKLAF
jgi:hypothetical protein